MAKISIILPVYRGAAGLVSALDSVLAQTEQDWELIAVNEFGSDDGSADILEGYQSRDRRIRLMQNERRLGLADSLNRGIRMASGPLIARMDADDRSHPRRLEKQAAFLADHPEVGVCGTWQRHIGPGVNRVHRPPVEPDRLAASLLFTCELCHSTVMLRRETLERHQLTYDNRVHAEDYELWTRMISVTRAANLPEVLGEYHVGQTITVKKKAALEREHGMLCSRALERNLGLVVLPEDQPLLNAWRNVFRQERDGELRREMRQRYAELLRRVYAANRETGFVAEDAMLETLRRRWLWANWDLRAGALRTNGLEAVFSPVILPKIRWAAQKLRDRAGRFFPE